MNLTAIDVETANPDMSSICQIGLVKYENSVLSDEWKSYVDPESYFNGVNVSIHGIDEAIVRGAPKFPELYGTLSSYLEGSVVVCHTHFDRFALYLASTRYDITPPASIWLDSTRLARRAWQVDVYSFHFLHRVSALLVSAFPHPYELYNTYATAPPLLTAAHEPVLHPD